MDVIQMSSSYLACLGISASDCNEQITVIIEFVLFHSSV